ncbi:CPBP family intramembrane glutamic endopeptidase [Arthrobacter sp.]|uniref:CPBP family intramembrane glutamic endopeptidase n=1 Tax=Arthrobacter sp. TaxID=1667 RepID=UPI0026DF3B24|nr:CPBP family intramembrane glutamic endopeptidase [Arthrobacter sp.]MDO5754000.1 CPBP family intramembrane metalloprotease [Arthrobacter sp.]
MSRIIDHPMAYRYDRPVAFYVLATVIPWSFWFLAAYLSQLDEQTAEVQVWTAVLGVCGLVAPIFVVILLVRRRADLRKDILQRLLPRRISWIYLGVTLLLLLASILAAQAVSLLFGYSPEQFQFRGGFTFSAGLLPVWFTLIGAAIFEELAWHSYGTDALIRSMSVFTASLVFTVFWALWHVPLGFIKGYYHNEVVEMGWLHTLNFPLSMVAFVILMNWLYFSTGRSILIAIIFHITANLANEVFMTHPDTKIIQTFLLLIVAGIVVAANRGLFFGRRPRSRQWIREYRQPA